MANLSHLPEQWRQSGLTQQAFCDREGIKLATFSYWRSKELEAQRGKPAPTACHDSSFTEVRIDTPTAAARSIEITYPDGTYVRLPLPGGLPPPC